MSLAMLKFAAKAKGVKAPKSIPGVDANNVQGTCQLVATLLISLALLLIIIAMATQSWIKGNAFGYDIKVGLKTASLNGNSVSLSDAADKYSVNDTMKTFFTKCNHAGDAIIGTGILSIFPIVAAIVVSVLLIRGKLPRKSTKWQGLWIGSLFWATVWMFLGLIIYSGMHGKFTGSLSGGSSFTTWVVAAVFCPIAAFGALASWRVHHPDDPPEEDEEMAKRQKAMAPSHKSTHNGTSF